MVSVIIVNYNAGDLLLQTIKNLLASSVPVQIILVDNGSTDTSLSTVKQYLSHPHQLLQNSTNKGFARACNQGMAQATGDYLLLLNPDCLIQENTLAQMIAQLELHPQAGMAGCRILNPDGTEQRGCRRDLPNVAQGAAKAAGLSGARAIDLHLTDLPQQPVFVPAISGAFMLVRRAAFEQVGGLDEDYFLHCEDLDWCKKFANQQWQILFVPEVEITHHQGACSHARPFSVLWHKHQGMMKYYDKHLANDHSWWFGLMVKGGILGRLLLTSAKTLLVK